MTVKMRGRGIVLISILVLTLLATFFIGALLKLNPSRLHRSVHDERHDRASAAAKAGVDFALAKLAQEPTWRGQGQGFVVKTDQLMVREDRGNVWGWIRAKEGEWTGFCFRFNYQDGANGADGLPQPDHIMPFEGISVNNLRGPSPLPLPLGDGAGYSFSGNYGYEVPEHSVALLVQGMVGPDIAPEKYPTDWKSSSVVRQVEGLYKASGLAGSLPDGAVLQAGADSEFLLGAQDGKGRGHLRLMADGQTAKMRTKGNSTIQQGTGKQADYNFYPDEDAEIRVGQTFTASTKSGQAFSQKEEKQSDPMLDIEWSKVSQSSQPDRLKLPAGVYTVSEGTGQGRVKYYDMTFKDYRKALISGTPPPAAPLPRDFPTLAENGGGSDGQVGARDVVEFDRDVEILHGSGSNKGLAIIPASGAKQQAVPTELDADAFNALGVDRQRQAGLAVFSYLTTSNPSGFSITANGQTFSYNPNNPLAGLSGGTPLDLATALWNSNGNISVGGEYGGGDDLIRMQMQQDPSMFINQLREVQSLPRALAESGDPLDIPNSVMSDSTVPQDLEIRFAPASGKSAAIRADGDILLGAHLSGKGGAVVAGGRVDLVGLGIDIEANQGERDGISVYAKDVINISTYDEKRQKYWDASIKGVLFSRKGIRVRLGEQSERVSPGWGMFDFQGAAVSLGEATAAFTNPELIGNSNQYQNGSILLNPGTSGYVKMIADGIRMTYEPKFLAPYVKGDDIVLRFQSVSVVER